MARLLSSVASTRYRFLFAARAPAENLLPNPGFEQLNPDTQYPEYWGKHWVYKGLWIVKQDAAFAHRGSVCLGVHQAGPEAHKAFTGLAGKRLDAERVRDHHASARVKGHGEVWFCIYFNTSSGFLGSMSSEPAKLDSDDWQQITWDFTVPEKKERDGRLLPVDKITVAYHVKGGPIWFDDVGLYYQGEQPSATDEPSYSTGDRVPLLTIPRTAGKIRIDGSTDDPGWADAVTTTGFFVLGGGLSPRQTQVLATFDETHLYVAWLVPKVMSRLWDEMDSVYVTAVDGEIAGFVSFATSAARKVGTIHYNGVAKAYRGLGIGAKQVEFAVEKFREAGMECAAVGTGLNEGHAPARRVYEKAGFETLIEYRMYAMKL